MAAFGKRREKREKVDTPPAAKHQKSVPQAGHEVCSLVRWGNDRPPASR